MSHTTFASPPMTVTAEPLAAVIEWLGWATEPFPGARRAIDGPDVHVVATGRLGSPNSSFDVYSTVRHLSARNAADDGTRSLVTVLEGPLSTSERALEDRLRHTLQHLDDFDDGPWDDAVVRSLDGAEHAFSVGGEAWSVELLHPQSPHVARRSPWPVLVVRPLPTRS